jgi:transposase-like protein
VSQAVSQGEEHELLIRLIHETDPAETDSVDVGTSSVMKSAALDGRTYVTEAVIEEVKLWQGQPLEEVYLIVYLDALMVKVRGEGHTLNKAIYVVLGVTLEGRKEVLGLWVAQTEGAKFWLQVLTDLQNRGVKDIFIACVDG